MWRKVHLYIITTFPGWQAVEHANALGWFGFQWTPELGERQVVHPGFPYQIPTMYFAGV